MTRLPSAGQEPTFRKDFLGWIKFASGRPSADVKAHDMNVVINDNIHHMHMEALGTQLVEETFWALENAGVIELATRREMAHAILFRIAAVLDGSAHGGTLKGEPVEPLVGFYYYRGETEELLVPTEGSGLHGIIGDLVNDFAGKDQ